MMSKEPKQTPQNPKHILSKEPEGVENCEKAESMLSPGFRSVVAMAGWDEEALVIASLVVEDTPDRDSKHQKRSDPLFKSPLTNSRRKRRAQRRSPISLAVPVLDLDEEQTSREEAESEKNKARSKTKSKEEKKKMGEDELPEKGIGVSCSSSSLPCMDRLREELSCAICLEICFEPSTTPCGHSFCKKCLRSAADKCGKRCPKCRQLIGNGRSCTVNTVLWNTIQLLFPQEVEARKAAGGLNHRESEHQSCERRSYYNVRNRSIQALNSPEPENSHGLRIQSVRSLATSSRGNDRGRRIRGGLSQDEDAALALRLQREEFMEAFRGSDEQFSRSSFNSARANLRAMASRAVDIRIRRGRPT
ncbi:hypothetical protein ACSBR2_022536 [Camellia fascicularis]